MMRTRLRKVVDPLLAALLVTVVTTGLLAGRAGERAEDLVHVHVAAAFLFLALLVVHVSVNWPILKAAYSRKKKRDRTST